jgi:hypothetical protein
VGPLDIAFLIFIILAVAGVGLFFLNRWASKRMADQQGIIERTKQPATIYVIDKKKERLQKANFPKAVQAQIPKWNRFMKAPLVKAKVGPQIMTLMCDPQVFDALPLKKSVKVELAGIYIVTMKGMKTKKEMKEHRRLQKSRVKDADKPRKHGKK